MPILIRHSFFVLCLAALSALSAAEPSSLPAPDSPSSIGWLLGGLAALLVIANQILTFIRHFRQDPPHHALYATKADLAKLETDLDARIAGLSTASAQSREKVYNLLAELRDAIARLETQAETQAQQLSRLDIKLDAVSDRATAAKTQAEAARHYTP